MAMTKKVKTYFFDSYAFYEIIEGNKNYEHYTMNIAIITTRLNLMELHYGLLLKYGKREADKYYDEFVQFSINFSDEIIKKANEFRASLKHRKLSYVDCVGYITALSRNIPFLTGDLQFKDLENVEYVK